MATQMSLPMPWKSNKENVGSRSKAEKVRGCQRAESGSGACRCWPSALALRGQLEGQLGSLVTSRGAADKIYSGLVSLCAMAASFTGCPWDVILMDYEGGDRAGTDCSASPASATTTGHVHHDGCGRTTPSSSRMRTSAKYDSEENMP